MNKIDMIIDELVGRVKYEVKTDVAMKLTVEMDKIKDNTAWPNKTKTIYLDAIKKCLDVVRDY